MEKLEATTWIPQVMVSPKFQEKIVLLAHVVEQCPVCKKYMLHTIRQPVMPIDVTIEAQLKRAGINRISSVTDQNDHLICDVCAKAGKASFTCWLCQETRNTDQIQDSFGDPPSRLCTVCYGSVTAAKWDKAVEELHEIHRYDYQ